MEPTEPPPPKYPHSDITGRIIAAAIEVHRCLGPGLMESFYSSCLAREFELRGMSAVREASMPVEYKGAAVGAAFRADFLVEDKVLVELKAVDTSACHVAAEGSAARTFPPYPLRPNLTDPSQGRTAR